MRAGKIAAGVLLALVAVLGVGTALSWAPDRPVETLTARWAPPPSQFVPLQGMQVHLRDEGPRTDPQPIVLLHGTSASLHTWEGWVKALKAQRRVITLDLPGFGLTGPFGGHDYSMKRQVEVLIAIEGEAPAVSGLYAEGRILSDAAATQLPSLPESAIQSKYGRHYVWQLQGSKLARVEVQLGERDLRRGEFPVKSGLAANARVLRNPGSSLVDGQAAELSASAVGTQGG